jgi:hypothetical protein
MSQHIIRSMSADLTGQTNGFFSEAEDTFPRFTGIITSGEHIDDPGNPVLAWPMPWDHLRFMDLDDFEAVYAYLNNVPVRSGANDKLTQDAARYCTMDSDCNATAGETCATATHECIGATCTGPGDCGACQTCTAGHCAAPVTGAACLTSGL